MIKIRFESQILALFEQLSFTKYNNFFWVCWFLAKNLIFWDPPLKKFHNRTDLDWSATAIFMSRKEPNCFRKSLHDFASASSFYAWNENGNYLFSFLFLYSILLISSREKFSTKTENGRRIRHFHGIFDQKLVKIRVFI